MRFKASCLYLHVAWRADGAVSSATNDLRDLGRRTAETLSGRFGRLYAHVGRAFGFDLEASPGATFAASTCSCGTTLVWPKSSSMFCSAQSEYLREIVGYVVFQREAGASLAGPGDRASLGSSWDCPVKGTFFGRAPLEDRSKREGLLVQ